MAREFFGEKFVREIRLRLVMRELGAMSLQKVISGQMKPGVASMRLRKAFEIWHRRNKRGNMCDPKLMEERGFFCMFEDIERVISDVA